MRVASVRHLVRFEIFRQATKKLVGRCCRRAAVVARRVMSSVHSVDQAENERGSAPCWAQAALAH